MTVLPASGQLGHGKVFVAFVSCFLGFFVVVVIYKFQMLRLILSNKSM